MDKKTIDLSLIFSCLTILSLLIYCGLFNYPQVDDYWYAVRGFDQKIFESMVHEYKTWGGRYMATVLIVHSPLVWGKLIHYQLLPVAVITLLFLSFLTLTHVVFEFRGKQKYFYSLLLTTVFLLGIPAIAQTIFWWAGTATYTVATAMTGFLISTYFSQIKTWLKMILITFILIISQGLNETTMILHLYLISVCFIWNFLQYKKVEKDLIYYFIVAFILAVIVLKAPGNSVRGNQFEKSYQVFRTISNSFIYSFVYPFKLLSFSLVGLLPFVAQDLRKGKFCKFVSNHKKWVCLIILGMIFITFAPSLWGMGRKPNARTLVITYHAYFLISLPLLVAFVKESWIKKLPTYVTLICLFIGINFFELVKDIYFKKLESNEEMWKNYLSFQPNFKEPVEEMWPMTIRFKSQEHEENIHLYLKKRNDFFK